MIAIEAGEQWVSMAQRVNDEYKTVERCTGVERESTGC